MQPTYIIACLFTLYYAIPVPPKDILNSEDDVNVLTEYPHSHRTLHQTEMNNHLEYTKKKYKEEDPDWKMSFEDDDISKSGSEDDSNIAIVTPLKFPHYIITNSVSESDHSQYTAHEEPYLFQDIVVASIHGDIISVLEILGRGNIDSQCDAINEAVRSGNTELVTILLNDGRIDPTIHHNQALRDAAFLGLADIIKVLLEDRPSVIEDNKEIYGENALFVACSSGTDQKHTECCKLLLEKVHPSTIMPRILYASHNGEAIKLILRDARTCLSSSDIISVSKSLIEIHNGDEDKQQKYPSVESEIEILALIKDLKVVEMLIKGYEKFKG